MKIQKKFFDHKDVLDPFLKVQEKVFPWLNMRWAVSKGLMPPTTTPFGLFDNGQALSIMTATEMTIVVDDQRIKTVQFGTVATDPGFTNRGYSKQLINYALDYYVKRTELVFLYANESVLEFYPQFGFKRTKEQAYICEVPGQDSCRRARKVDPERSDDLELIDRIIRNRTRLSSEFYVDDYTHLARWYCLAFMKDNLWYCEEVETLLVAAMIGDTLFVYDVIAKQIDPSLFENLWWEGAKTVQLNFIPDKFEGSFRELSDAYKTDPLFVIGSFGAADRRPFIIPALAHT